MEAALIQQCADPNLKPAIVEKFIARVPALAILSRSPFAPVDV